MGWYLTFVLGPKNSFPLSLTTKHFLGDLWIITSEEEESRRQRKKQRKKKKMGWAVPALSNRKLNPKPELYISWDPEWNASFTASITMNGDNINGTGQGYCPDSLITCRILASFYFSFTNQCTSNYSFLPLENTSSKLLISSTKPSNSPPRTDFILASVLWLGPFLPWTSFHSPVVEDGPMNSALLVHLITPYDVCPWVVLGRGT